MSEQRSASGRSANGRSSNGRSSNGRSSNGRSANGGGDGSRPTRTAVPSAAQLTRRACAELAELLGRAPEGVVSLERTDDGWRLGVEVVETRRIPDTADVLAEYEVEVDKRGRLMGYRRARRYARGQVRDES